MWSNGVVKRRGQTACGQTAWSNGVVKGRDAAKLGLGLAMVENSVVCAREGGREGEEWG